MNFKQYRPNNLEEFVGQEDIKYSLQVYLNACVSQQVVLDHLLIIGPSGVGKTSLALIIANTLNSKINFVQGSHLKKIADVLNIFSLLNPGEIIFIDEAHMIDKSIFEFLYTIVEDFVIDVPLGPDNNQKINRMKVPKFTLICATNFISKLPNSFVDRFPIQLYLNQYTESDLVKILEQIIDKETITNLKTDELVYIASIAKNNPRNAINYLKRYLDFKMTHSENLSIQTIFEKIGIFANGLNKLDIAYLQLLNQKQTISLQAISQCLNLDKTSIENKIEYYLLKNDFISINSKGRKLTIKGEKYLSQLK